MTEKAGGKMNNISVLLNESRQKYQRLHAVSLTLSFTMLLLITLSIALALLAVFTGQSGVAELLGWPKALTIQEINDNWKIICGVIALLDIFAFVIHRLERGFDLRGRMVLFQKQQFLLERLQQVVDSKTLDQQQLAQTLEILKTLTQK